MHPNKKRQKKEREYGDGVVPFDNANQKLLSNFIGLPNFLYENIGIIMRKSPFRVSIEGNIGAGKSTLIEYYRKFPNVDVHPEPVSSWCNIKGSNLLDLVYHDLNTWTFPFQHYVQLSRVKIQTAPPSNPNIKVQMFERSLQNSRYCFTENSYKQGHLTEAEYQVLCSWYDWLENSMDIGLDLIVYLRSTPEVVYKRMIERCRSEEISVPLDYLTQVHESYEDWLMRTPADKLPAPVLVIDVDQSIDTVVKFYEQHRKKILGSEML